MSDDRALGLSPYCPVDFTKYNTYVSPEGGFRPVGDTWPLYPFEFTNWWDEELSWHDTTYIHCGLNPFIWFHAKGSDLPKLLSDVSVNTFNNFPVSKARHVIICTEEGKIMIDGICIHCSEDEYDLMCLPDPQMLNQMAGGRYQIESEEVGSKRFFYQMCGPHTLEVIEQAARKDLHDLEFMHVSYAEIEGCKVRVLRTGMAGTLGYEVHGMFDDAVTVYKALMKAGERFGIRELGRHAYRNTHTEGTIPQGGLHFKFKMPVAEEAIPTIAGSLDPTSELVYRSPIQLGWGNLVHFDHDFPGKSALESEMAAPHKTGVTLVWDKDDVLSVIRACLEPGERVDVMDMVEDWDPVGSSNTTRLDAVYDGDRLIGAASGRMLSPKTREMISLATVDEEYAQEGKTVEVLWGNPGTRQMRIKAKVVTGPYIKEGRNDNFDIESIPHPVFD